MIRTLLIRSEESVKKRNPWDYRLMIGLLMMAYLGRRSLKNGYWASL